MMFHPKLFSYFIILWVFRGLIVYQMGRLCGGAHEISGIKAPLFLHGGWLEGFWDGWVVVGWVVGWVDGGGVGNGVVDGGKVGHGVGGWDCGGGWVMGWVGGWW